jgi:TPR repeat protein
MMTASTKTVLVILLLASLALWWSNVAREAQVDQHRQSPAQQAVNSASPQAPTELSGTSPSTAGNGRDKIAATADAASEGQRDGAVPEDARTQIALGDSYLAGNGVEIDPGLAAHWYRQAAEQGDPAAQLRLGELYEQGIGVTQDLGEALTWYGLAAEQGDAAAQANLGDHYESGPGIRSNKAAVHYYRLAASQGHREAQTDLGRMYELGKGVTADPAQAYRWYSRAADQGDALAAQGRDRVRRQLSPAQIAEGAGEDAGL